MNCTNKTGNMVRCECGGYLKPEGIDTHLETRIHFDRMRYPNGFKYETTDKLTYVVIYDKCATMEEKEEAIRTYPNVDRRMHIFEIHEGSKLRPSCKSL